MLPARPNGEVFFFGRGNVGIWFNGEKPSIEDARVLGSILLGTSTPRAATKEESGLVDSAIARQKEIALQKQQERQVRLETETQKREEKVRIINTCELHLYWRVTLLEELSKAIENFSKDFKIKKLTEKKVLPNSNQP